MTVEYEIRTTRLTVVTKDDPIFSETATHVSIEDEAAGEYIKISQCTGSIKAEDQSIMVYKEEWPTLKKAIDQMIAELR